MAVYTEAIQKLYVAYFNRPADYEGLNYWEKVVTAAKGDTSAVSAAFAGSAEYKAAYAGMSNLQIVATVYKNLFGETNPDLKGLEFWANALQDKKMTIDNVVTQIAAGAQGTHKDAYAAKVAAATAFTAALDTVPEILAYTGDAANAIGKAFITSVKDDASLKAAIDTAALNATINTVLDNGPLSQGKTFTLTAGQDLIVGTAGNDVINVNAFNATTGAEANNMSSIDTIDGGDGKDTLNIEVKDNSTDATNLNGVLATTIKNVEIINLNQVGADAAALATVDGSKFVGATQINQIGKAANVTKLAAGTTAGFDTVAAAAYSVGAAGATAAVSLNKVAEAATFAVGGTKLTGVTVSGNRADTNDDGSLTALALTVTAGTDVQTVTVTTDQKTTLTLAEDVDSVKHVSTVNASGSTGAVTFVGNANAASISTGSGKDVITTNAATSTTVSATVSTGAGDDTLVVSTTGTGTTTVDGGAGADKITLNKAVGNTLNVQGGDGNDTVIINGTVETADVINGGAGTDTVQVAGKATRVADDFIVFNKLLTGFETIKFSSAEGTGTALDASLLAANYTTIDLFAGSSVTKVGAAQALVANGGLTAQAAGYGVDPDAPRAGSLNITEKATGTVTANADTVALTVKAATAAGGNVTAALAGDFTTASVTLTNSVNATSNATADTIAKVTVDTALTATAMTSLTLSGNGTATVNNGAGSKLVTVDASATGGQYTLGGMTGELTTGLVYTSTNTRAETVKLGAGVDSVVVGASTYGKVDTISGLKLVTNTAGTALSTLKSDQLNVTGFNAAAGGKFTTTQTDLDLALKDAAVSTKGDSLVFQMGGDTYVYVDQGTAGVVDAADIVVKLTGTIDLDALLVALGTPIV